jgi:pseudomonalisin
MTRSGCVSTGLLWGSLVFLSVVSCDGLPIEEGNSANLPSTASSETTAANTVTANTTTVVAPLRARPVTRVTGTIDLQDRVALTGHRHPLARSEFETGRASSDHLMQNMMLVLRADSTQDQALEALIRAQHDPSSSLYHQWLTPETYAEQFGIADSDVASTTSWLKSQGMVIEQVVNGGRQILFTGTAAQVEDTFHTTMHTYQVKGEIHHANATDPEIPRGLSSVVSGVVSLHDFRSTPANVQAKAPNAENSWFFGGKQYSALAPQDVAIIYNATPLYAASIDGTGQSIAVLGRSNIDLAEVRTFRKNFGLPANDPQIVLAGTDPGILTSGDEVESYLDVEWAGAIAKNATIKFVVSGSSTTTDGIYLAAIYAISHNVAPIVSLSYGLCEQSLGVSGNLFMNTLWQQAATQGISVLVSSGDSGAAGCDAMNAKTATGGLGVNGLGSTPFNTAVGGTQFDDVSNHTTYWATTNDSATQASALGYIPELAWNESSGSGLYSTGGGKSSVYAKPTWQAGFGVVADGKRDVPDVAFAAAVQEPYEVYGNKQLMGVGGTSAATPVFASIMALVLQKVGQAQGLVNPVLYGLASNQKNNNGAAIFHDVTQGNNTVPGVTGYSAGDGFDMVTGLGSVDATALVNHWQDQTIQPDFGIAAVSSSASVLPSSSTTVGFTVKANSTWTAAIQFSVTGLPAGVTSTFSPATLSTSGSTTLTFVAAASVTAGVYAVNVVGTSGTTSHSAALSLTVVNAPALVMTLSSSSMDAAVGSSGTTKINTTRNSAFNAAVSLSVTGAPKGVTIKLSSTSIAAPGAGTSSLTATVAATTTIGTYPVTVTATGGGVTKTALLAINVLPAPGFSLTLSPSSLTVAPGARGTTTATIVRNTTFNSAVSVKVTGPTGISASTGSIAASGSGASPLTITVASTVSGGAYPLTVTATGGGVTKTTTLTLLVPGLTLSSNRSALTLQRTGDKDFVNLTSTMLGGFSSAVTFSVQGLPSGVSATFAPNSLTAPGNGTTVLKLANNSSTMVGSTPIIVKATAGSVVRTLTLTLALTK